MISANEAWFNTLQNLVAYGSQEEARGLMFKELRHHATVFDMKDPIITIPERELGYKFMPAEAYWILTGDNRVETIAPYSKAISQFSDDGRFFDGAYGPMVVQQLRYVVECLANDPGSRQAVIDIWRPNPRPSKDIPCTLSLQFMIRQHQLHCVATMRSSDIWLGWVYDCFNFTSIAFYILEMLAKDYKRFYELGMCCITAGSQHIYNRDLEKATKIVAKYSQQFHLNMLPQAYFPGRLQSPFAFLEWLQQKMVGGIHT